MIWNGRDESVDKPVTCLNQVQDNKQNRKSHCRRQLLTYHYQCKGDHDSSQELVGYGVLFEGVSDGLIVTEETPFERAVLRG